MKGLAGWNSNAKTHIGGWKIYFTRLGMLRPGWYQRAFEAWWCLTGKWSLHKAWQAGFDRGVRLEYERVVENWGDLGPILNRVIDVTRFRADMNNNEILAEVARKIYEEEESNGTSGQQKSNRH